MESAPGRNRARAERLRSASAAMLARRRTRLERKKIIFHIKLFLLIIIINSFTITHCFNAFLFNNIIIFLLETFLCCLEGFDIQNHLFNFLAFSELKMLYYLSLLSLYNLFSM